MSNIPSLYHLADQYQQLLDLDIPAEQKEDTLSLIEEDIHKKGQAIGAVLQSFDAQEAALKHHILGVQDRLKAIQNHRKRLTEYLKENMERCGIQKIESPYFVVSLQKSPESVVIDDEDSVPDDFCRFTKSPDKTLIKAALRDNYEVPGCRLESGTHVRIR